MYTREELIERLAKGFSMQRDKFEDVHLDTPLLFYSYQELINNNNIDYLTFRPRDFAVIDKRLPDCLAHLYENQIATGNSDFRIRSEQIDWMLRYWRREHLVLPIEAIQAKAFASPALGFDHYIEELTDFRFYPQLKVVQIVCKEYVMDYDDSGVEYPRTLKQKALELKTTWLDENIPQWKSKIDIAAGLNLEPKELGEFFFAEYYKAQLQERRQQAPKKNACDNEVTSGLGSDLPAEAVSAHAITLPITLPGTLTEP